MADQKISQLTALTTQASADELVIVDSSATQTKKITVNNLFQGIPVNVGIGTASPAVVFDVQGNTQDVVGVFRSTDATGKIGLMDNTTTNTYSVTVGAVGNELVFGSGTNGVEAMRIDADGNLLVGTTATSVAGDGARLMADGQARFAKASDAALLLNRNTTDGTVADFRKDNTTVGSIGTQSSNFYLGSGDVTLYFSSGGDTIIPRGTNGNARSGAIDLGNAGNTWKDLYLSGGAYLGGTAAANILDDFEEGTFTPVVADAASGGNTATVGTATGTYVKIGMLVYVTINLVNIDTTGLTGSNTLHVRSLPFTSGSAFEKTSYGTVFLDSVNVDDSSIGIVSQVLTNTTVLKFRVSRDATTDIDLTVSTLTSGSADISTTICYLVA